jgi:hypothetical protein
MKRLNYDQMARLGRIKALYAIRLKQRGEAPKRKTVSMPMFHFRTGGVFQ